MVLIYMNFLGCLLNNIKHTTDGKSKTEADDILKNGMVFSDEPGVYFEGKFGIRIEDTILLENGIAQSLTDSDKNLIIL